MGQQIEVELGIGRDSSDTYYITVSDEASGRQFLDIRMTAEQFAMALTGLRGGSIKAEVNSLDVVGKEKVSEARTAVCPLADYDRNTLRAWLFENCKEEGWEIDGYLGSQGSVRGNPNGKGQLLSYRVFKFVDNA